MSEIFLAVTIFAILACWLYTIAQKEKDIRDQRDKWGYERAAWKEERQQLLDRIQAGSFAEYKTQEVRVIKAQTGEKEPPKLEQL